MIEKQPFSGQLIVDSLANYFDIGVAKLTFLPLGADANASVYEAQTKDGGSCFVKLKRCHHHDLSITILELLQDAGIEQIIAPIKNVHGQPTQAIDDFTLIVYPFVKGQDGFSLGLTDEQWVILGRTLRQVHEVDVPAAIRKEVRREAYSPKWREALRALYEYMEKPPESDEWAAKLVEFMKGHSEPIHRLADSAERLAEKRKDVPAEFVLSHSDIHGGNVMIDDAGAIYLVDWDDPMMAPKERDLMFIGGGIGNVWNEPDEERLFYLGYGSVDVNPLLLAYYRLERIVEDLALFGQDLLTTTAGGENRPQAYEFFTGMFEPGGVVEIAFKTNEAISE
jgi:spectinomycin phosphotransferase